MEMPIEMYKKFLGRCSRRFVASSRVHSCFAPSSAQSSHSPVQRSGEALLVMARCFAAVVVSRSTSGQSCTRLGQQGHWGLD